jgi:hypothetical protein
MNTSCLFNDNAVTRDLSKFLFALITSDSESFNALILHVIFVFSRRNPGAVSMRISELKLLQNNRQITF